MIRQEHPQAALLATIVTGETNVSSSGFPYISDQSFNLFVQKIPHLFRHGAETLQWLGSRKKQLATENLPLLEEQSIQRAIKVLQTVVFTAGVTAPPDLWLLKQVLSAHQRLGITADLLDPEGLHPEEYAKRRKLEPRQLASDLNLIYSRGYLKKIGPRFFIADDPLVAAVVDAPPLIEERHRIDVVQVLTSWFARPKSHDQDGFLKEWLKIDHNERPTGSWVADRFQIELGYRLLPLILSLRVCGLTDHLIDGAIVEQVSPMLPEMVTLLEQAGLIADGRVSELGARVFERGPGPFGIIAAYHSYLNSLETLLISGRGEARVQRGANVAASQDANRKTFEEANDRLDAFCEEYGFRYSVFIEHAVGRGEATRQRFLRRGEENIRYFGADLEDAAINQALIQQDRGFLPKNMEFIRSADIGNPEKVIDFLKERGLVDQSIVMMVGNGFHEIREQTNSKMIRVFQTYQEAGILLIFTEESALDNDDLQQTAWNTYHAGFRYVHELSGQGLRPATDRAGRSGRWSWHRCATEAGYTVLEQFSYKSRSIYPYKRPERDNPCISETYFCVPHKIALSLIRVRP